MKEYHPRISAQEFTKWYDSANLTYRIKFETILEDKLRAISIANEKELQAFFLQKKLNLSALEIQELSIQKNYIESGVYLIDPLFLYLFCVNFCPHLLEQLAPSPVPQDRGMYPSLEPKKSGNIAHALAFIALVIVKAAAILSGIYPLERIYQACRHLLTGKKPFKGLLQLGGAGGGAYGGFLAGSILGAAAGSIIPGLGTAIGGVLGGIVGALIGASVGTLISKYVGKAIMAGKFIVNKIKDAPTDSLVSLTNPGKYHISPEGLWRMTADAENVHVHTSTKLTYQFMREIRAIKNSDLLANLPFTDARAKKNRLNEYIAALKDGRLIVTAEAIYTLGFFGQPCIFMSAELKNNLSQVNAAALLPVPKY